MMRAIFLLSIAVIYAGQARAQDSEPASWDDATDLFGRWHVEAFSLPQDVPLTCSGASVEFRRDHTVIARSGHQILKGYFVVEHRAGRLLITQQITEHNGNPNCQGYAADFVLDNHQPRMYAEIDGDAIRLFESEAAKIPIARLIREK